MTVTDRPELSPTAAEPTRPTERAPQMMLEICRGRTRFPQRPISGPRFLIGSGAGCDLRLGGSDFPAIHSLIQTRENGVWFETLATAPTARINDEMTTGEWLRDGDRIEIGAFHFLAHAVPLLPPMAIVDAPASQARDAAITGPLSEWALDKLSDLSATELADRLDVEMNEVERFQGGRRAGGHALLHALRRRSQEPAQLVARAIPAMPSVPGTTPAPAQHELQIDLDRLCKDLEELTSTLERRSELISQREFQFADAAEALLETQRQLVSQLELALEHAAQLGESRDVPMKHAIRVSA